MNLVYVKAVPDVDPLIDPDCLGLRPSHSGTHLSDLAGKKTRTKEQKKFGRRGKKKKGRISLLAPGLSDWPLHLETSPGEDYEEELDQAIEDLSGQLRSVTMFPDQFNLYKDLLFDNNTLLLEGKIESRGGDKQLIVDKVFQIWIVVIL